MTVAISRRRRGGREGGGLRLDRQHLGVAPPPTPPGPGMTCAVLVPRGQDRRRQARPGDRARRALLQVEGNFDDCLELARKLADELPGRAGQLGQPVPHRGPEDRGVRGRRRARRRARRPLPAGRQRRQHHRLLEGLPRVRRRRRPPAATHRRGCGASRPPAPRRSCSAQPVDDPETIATAIRIGNPASWAQALAARDESGGRIDAVTDEQILAAHRLLAAPRASSSSRRPPRRVAGLLAGRTPRAVLDAGPARRLHGHRPRAQGPGVGDLRGADGERGRPVGAGRRVAPRPLAAARPRG